MPDVVVLAGATVVDGSVTADSLANNIDATAKGFDADKVDGADAGVAADDVLKIPSALAEGDILQADSTPNVIRLAAGIDGQFLKTQGSSNPPIWANNFPLANATQPVNSNGNSFSTIQAAINDLGSDGWVYAPPGTYAEAIIISGDNIILMGAGWSTIIDASTINHAIRPNGNFCTVRDLQCKTTQGEGNNFNGVRIGGANNLVHNVYVSSADNAGIAFVGEFGIASNCLVKNTDGFGIEFASTSDNSQAVANVVDTTGDDGVNININAENCLVVANRITNWTNEAIDDDSGTSTVGNNETT